MVKIFARGNRHNYQIMAEISRPWGGSPLVSLYKYLGVEGYKAHNSKA
jgi:hypothetical protein